MKKTIFFITLFISITLFGQSRSQVEVDLSTPRSAIRTHLHFLSTKDYQPQKSAKVIQGYQGEEAEELAIKIKKILQGRGLVVAFAKVPNNPNFVDTVSNEQTNRYVLFPERMPQIYLEKVGKKWYYSKETLSHIDTLYDEVFPWYARKIQQLIPKFGNRSFWGIPAWKYMGLMLLLVISF